MNLLKYMQILSFVLPLAFLSCSNDTIEDVHFIPQTKIGQKLLAGSETVARIYTDTALLSHWELRKQMSISRKQTVAPRIYL